MSRPLRLAGEPRSDHVEAKMSANQRLDVRELSLADGLEVVLASFDALAPGGAVDLVVGLRPRPLLTALQDRRRGQLKFRTLQSFDRGIVLEMRHVPPGHERPSDMLCSEHGQFEVELGAIRDMLLLTARQSAIERFGSLRSRLLHHMDAEEHLVFPQLERLGAELRGLLAVTRVEHHSIRESLEWLSDAISDGEPEPCARMLEDLLNLLDQHLLREELVLYPAVDLALDDGAQRSLIAELKSA